MNKQHIEMIVRNLMTEYSEREAREMLDSAEFSEIDGGYKVRYDDVHEDKFLFVTTIVHESEVDFYKRSGS